MEKTTNNARNSACTALARQTPETEALELSPQNRQKTAASARSLDLWKSDGIDHPEQIAELREVYRGLAQEGIVGPNELRLFLLSDDSRHALSSTSMTKALRMTIKHWRTPSGNPLSNNNLAGFSTWPGHEQLAFLDRALLCYDVRIGGGDSTKALRDDLCAVLCEQPWALLPNEWKKPTLRSAFAYTLNLRSSKKGNSSPAVVAPRPLSNTHGYLDEPLQRISKVIANLVKLPFQDSKCIEEALDLVLDVLPFYDHEQSAEGLQSIFNLLFSQMHHLDSAACEKVIPLFAKVLNRATLDAATREKLVDLIGEKLGPEHREQLSYAVWASAEKISTKKGAKPISYGTISRAIGEHQNTPTTWSFDLALDVFSESASPKARLIRQFKRSLKLPSRQCAHELYYMVRNAQDVSMEDRLEVAEYIFTTLASYTRYSTGGYGNGYRGPGWMKTPFFQNDALRLGMALCDWTRSVSSHRSISEARMQFVRASHSGSVGLVQYEPDETKASRRDGYYQVWLTIEDGTSDPNRTHLP